MQTVFSAGILGIDAYLIHVEVHCAYGHPGWITVGLPEHEVTEGKERVLTALSNCNFEVPYNKFTINLAPAAIRKEGTALDLPIALGLLASYIDTLKEKLSEFILVGELSLDGKLRPIRGTLAMAMMAANNNFPSIIVPKANAQEACLEKRISVYGVETLQEVVDFILGQRDFQVETSIVNEAPILYNVNFSEVCGQHLAKRALEIAAAGFHNVLMMGAPGCGKSMLAKRLPSILPTLSWEEQITNIKIYSLVKNGSPSFAESQTRPFRSPHTNISTSGLIGGGSYPKPGEITLANHGILFLDELPEYHRSTLEALRQPMEDRHLTITRSNVSLTFPANFLMVAAMNPCPCGNYFSNGQYACKCSPNTVEHYRSKISGPLLDRIDLQIELTPVSFSELAEHRDAESSETIRKRVLSARTLQEDRFYGKPYQFNSQMTDADLKQYCELNNGCLRLIHLAMQKYNLSARSYSRILKVSRTIADLANHQKIAEAHILEALQFKLCN